VGPLGLAKLGAKHGTKWCELGALLEVQITLIQTLLRKVLLAAIAQPCHVLLTRAEQLSGSPNPQLRSLSIAITVEA
jgi:hypothetical protein